jgi:hypothetical protein
VVFVYNCSNFCAASDTGENVSEQIEENSIVKTKASAVEKSYFGTGGRRCKSCHSGQTGMQRNKLARRKVFFRLLPCFFLN